jgi:hypothetical protein
LVLWCCLGEAGTNNPPRPTEPNWLSTGLVKLYALFNPFGRPYGGTGNTSNGSSGNGN